MLIALLLLATISSAAFCVLWITARSEIRQVEGQLEQARKRLMSDDQIRESEARLVAMRETVAMEQKDAAARVASSQQELDAIMHDLNPAREIRDLRNELAKGKQDLKSLHRELEYARDQRELNDLGFRRREFTYADPASYQKAIRDIEDQQANMLKAGAAAKCNKNWTIEGSEKKGEQMISKLMKLALRTFNADSDAAIAKVTWKNIDSMSDRIRKSEDTIEKTLDKWGIVIIDHYRDLKIKELQLTFEHAEIEQKIKEEQRELREQQREEERARREAEAAEREAAREERRVAEALEKAKREMAESHTTDMTKHLSRIQELESQLALAGENRQRAISMAELTKMGNVYIVSNIGSFGEEILKIGMTRRMDPMDRIWELSDASVPFDFDVHGMIKTDDAPALESTLHRHFENRRLNLVNLRKEFFRVTLHEVQAVVSKMGLDVQLSLAAEAREHHESLALRKMPGEKG